MLDAEPLQIGGSFSQTLDGLGAVHDSNIPQPIADETPEAISGRQRTTWLNSGT
jgi:hypothetical protein